MTRLVVHTPYCSFEHFTLSSVDTDYVSMLVSQFKFGGSEIRVLMDAGGVLIPLWDSFNGFGGYVYENFPRKAS